MKWLTKLQEIVLNPVGYKNNKIVAHLNNEKIDSYWSLNNEMIKQHID